MSDNNRNRNTSHGSEENWNQEDRYDQKKHQQRQFGQQGQYGQQGHQYGNAGNMNYDQDRNRDNYSGSSYGYAGSSQQDWDRYNQGSGSDYNQQNQGYSGNYGSNSGAQYGNRREGESGNYSGSNYGQWGQSGQRGQYGRRDDMSGYQDRNQSGSNYGSSYGTSGGYGTYGGNRSDESGYGNTSGNYGSSYGANRDRGNWGNQGNRDDRGWWEKTRDEVSSWFGDEDAERRRRRDQMVSGQHKGKGPRDYRRSDERILEDACDRLSDDSFVDASEIDVKVTGSEVILTGTVESREAKRRAEDIVESISGVTNVQNNLKVNSRHDSSGLRSSDSAR